MACSRPVLDRLVQYIEPDGDCWMWVGAYHKGGYGKFKAPGGISTAAHLALYLCLVGPIPKGKQLDHLCRRPACLNPDHLEPVPSRINTLRGNSPTAINARKTRCGRGHPFTQQNTRIEAGGRRRCLACRSEHNRHYYQTVTRPKQLAAGGGRRG